MSGKIVGCSIVAASIAFGAVMVWSCILPEKRIEVTINGIAKEKVRALKDVEIKAQKIAKEMGWEIIDVPSCSCASLEFSNENSPEEKWSSYWDKMVNP
jgi:hypothetical protein